MKIQLYNAKRDCCGCKACGNICPVGAIIYTADEYGFFYPEIDVDKCVKCGQCIEVCDFQKLKKAEIPGQYPRSCFAAVNKDDETLKKSSSGGVFAAIAEIVLEKDGIVCGCVFDDNLIPIHVCAESRDAIIPMHGSKYVQSDIGDIYCKVKQYLKAGRFVLFTGTPCQIAALRSYLGDFPCNHLLALEIICHGTSSPGLFKEYLSFIEKKYHTCITKYFFRSKRGAWGVKDYTFDQQFISLDGKKRATPAVVAAAYMTNYRQNNLHREACFACKYARPERVSDITMGDFWGYDKIGVTLPAKKGLSIMFLNTEKAIGLLPEITKKMELEEIYDLDAAVASNGNMHRPSPCGDKWDYFMTSFRNGKAGEAFEKYGIENRKIIIKKCLMNAMPLPLIKLMRQVKGIVKKR